MRTSTKVFLIWAAIIAASPFWAPQTRSVIEWAMVGKPAACFQIESMTILGWTTSACSDWKYCDPDDEKNIAKRYSCHRQKEAKKDQAK